MMQWSVAGGRVILGSFGAQNRINFTKFKHDFVENILMTKGLSQLCTENGAGKSLSRRSMGLRGREKDGDTGANVVHISIMD
jgi:hypothetical protein